MRNTENKVIISKANDLRLKYKTPAEGIAQNTTQHKHMDRNLSHTSLTQREE